MPDTSESSSSSPSSTEEAFVRQFLHSPPAGPYASEFKLLNGENTVGGATLCFYMGEAPLSQMFPVVTTKNFTGRIIQLAIPIGGKPVFATALCFQPGAIEIIGARNKEHVRIVIHLLADLFARHGHPIRLCYISVDNKVAAGSFGFHVGLEMLDDNLENFVTAYDPELFPGIVCIWVGDDGGDPCTIVAFENGKARALGIDNMTQAQARYYDLCMSARPHKVDSNISRQDNKSRERTTRNNNQKLLRASGRGKAAGSINQGVKLGKGINDFIKKNPELRKDPQFKAKVREQMAVLVRDKLRLNATKERNKQARAQRAANVGTGRKSVVRR